MKIVSSILIIVFTFFTSCLAGEIKAEFSISTNISTVKEGDLLDGVLKIWPLENADYNEFKKLTNISIANSFILVQIQSIGPSSNNADVVEVKGIFVAKKSKGSSPSFIEYKGQAIIVSTPQISVLPLEKPSQEYFILNQKIESSLLGKMALGVFILVAFVVAFWKRNSMLSFFLKHKKDPKEILRKKYLTQILSASKREEFEELYAKKEEWMSLFFVEGLTISQQSFFTALNKHQYKKNWQQEDLIEVQNSFESIRGSLK